jgi:hypothetical protein
MNLKEPVCHLMLAVAVIDSGGTKMLEDLKKSVNRSILEYLGL